MVTTLLGYTVMRLMEKTSNQEIKFRADPNVRENAFE